MKDQLDIVSDKSKSQCLSSNLIMIIALVASTVLLCQLTNRITALETQDH